MRLASVTFAGLNNIGGARIPAIAFKKWCDILGVDCDFIDYTLLKDKTLLNNYNGVFFCTAINNIIRKEIKLEVPFISMLHAEIDNNLIIDSANSFAKKIVVIGKGYWENKYPYHGRYSDNKTLLWYPCCYPEYLINGSELWQPDRNGLVYSARLSTVKNAATLAGLTKFKKFLDIVGFVDVYGKENNPEYKKFLDSMDPNWNISNEIFDINDFAKNRERLKYYKYFWDVSCIPGSEFEIPRLNLAAYEAMKFGVIPIVDKRYTPEETHKYTLNLYQLSGKIDCNMLRENMREMISKGPYGYEAVKNQVIKIIEVFK